jgi:glycosyltransferase involved in cell wall biosynthesis
VKVLLLAPHSYYVDRGTPIDVDIVLRALSGRGEQVDAVVYHDGQDRDYPGVTIHRIRPPRWVGPVRPGFSIKKVICDVYLLRTAWRLARRKRYDVVHAGEEAAFVALWLKRVAGIPYIYDMDSSIAQQIVEQLPVLKAVSPLLNGLEGVAVRNAVATAPVCNALADLARHHGAREVVTLHDISQLGNPRRERTGELRRGLGVDGTLVMYVGNLEAYQGIDLLLEAFAHAAPRDGRLQLVIAGGSDDDIARYTKRVAAMGLPGRVHLIGRWPADRLDELLAEADILTVPRIRGINTAMKVFPFLHSGRPVLVTDLPTHTQILTDRIVAFAPPEPAGFAAALLDLAADPERQVELGRAGRAFVEAGHTYDAHRKRVDRLYDHVAAQVGSALPAASQRGALVPIVGGGTPARSEETPRGGSDETAERTITMGADS